ncbi:putative UDP-glycosyltransferase 90A1 [Iris pallida]|uniref:Glycosyltransferase n=1 Tax=Iris pallida TaxID=29817 RepID=A0AAX6FWI5_IRIPA|nr:putative UDP-glycosyltransferase 90A1 [Iris pallida]
MGSSPLPHIAIFPFLSKGHTIPLVHLAHLIRRRCLATLTFLTTPLNAPFLRSSLSDTDADVVELPFPGGVPGLPDGIESTDALPSIDLFLPFVAATKLLRPQFEHAVAGLPAVSFLISDGFYGWTTESAADLGLPRMVFYGMGSFAMTVSATVAREKPHAGLVSDDQPFPVPGFPQLQLTRNDMNPPFDDPNPSGPLHEFVTEQSIAAANSHGVVANTFYELEAAYTDRWNLHIGPRAWCVGPVCSARLQEPERGLSDSKLTRWLDARSATDRPVLYVAFGSQADVSAAQLNEIAVGLENSGADFLWVVRREGADQLGEGFEERVGDRGVVVREWVDQLEILRHGSVRGFVSHCGWNSVTESVCAGVPMLAWPMIAEQHLNAKFVVDVAGIGLRVRAGDGTKYGLVRREEVEEKVKELLFGEKGRMAAEKVKDLALASHKAMADGGSSASALEQMIDEVSGARKTD